MSDKPRSRLGKGLSSLLGTPVQVIQKQANEYNSAEKTAGAVKARHGVSGGLASPAAGSVISKSPGTMTSVPPLPTPSDRAGDGGNGEPAIHLLPIGALRPGKFQPRREMDETSLQGLAASIKSAGVMQPIAVRPAGAAATEQVKWEIVAGERRWRAAKLAGLEAVPAVVTSLNDRAAAEWGLVENLQREDLNPMDRAWGLKNLVDTFGLTQAEVAQRLGLDRSSVTNLIRLTELEASIQDLVRSGGLGQGHGKALLSHPSGPQRERLAKLAAAQEWPVRRLERAAGLAVSNGAGPAPLGGTTGTPDPFRADAAIRDLERQLSEHLGTRVRIVTGASRTKGRLLIDFYSVEHFDSLVGSLGAKLQ